MPPGSSAGGGRMNWNQVCLIQDCLSSYSILYIVLFWSWQNTKLTATFSKTVIRWGTTHFHLRILTFDFSWGIDCVVERGLYQERDALFFFFGKKCMSKHVQNTTSEKMKQRLNWLPQKDVEKNLRKHILQENHVGKLPAPIALARNQLDSAIGLVGGALSAGHACCFELFRVWDNTREMWKEVKQMSRCLGLF